MNTQTVRYKAKTFEARNLAFFFLIALLLTACAPSAPPSQPPTPLPVEQTDAAHAPVILRVEEREEMQNGQLFLSKDIYFTDPDGDATTVVNTLISTDPAEFSATVGDDVVSAPAGEQKQGAMVASAMRCPPSLHPFSLTIEDRIRDAAGNLSEPITVVFNCPAIPPNNLPYVIVVLVIGLGLLVGFWLYFRKHPTERTPTILSILLLLCVLILMQFVGSIIHEGGHALAGLIVAGIFETLYVHPFAFMGFSRPIIDNAWVHAGGYITTLSVTFIISALFWKRRSVANLPFVMFFPSVAFTNGIFIPLLIGDTANILRLTGLPAMLFIVLGLALFCVGLLSFPTLFPLLGLNPTDRKSILILPTAFYSLGAISMIVAYVFVPGSYIDSRYLLGMEILQSANNLAIFPPILGALLAVFYLTLFRKIQPKLPAWLHTETVALTWKHLCLPATLAVISLILGLIIIA